MVIEEEIVTRNSEFWVTICRGHGKMCTFAAANALVAELADAPDLGSGVARREGSSPFRRTEREE